MDISEELVKQIADRCHIDNMRNATKANDKNKHTTVDGKPLMYRKGMNIPSMFHLFLDQLG